MRRSWIIALLLVGASLAATTAAANPADKHLVLEADDGEGCQDNANVQVPPSQLDCYHVANGTLDGFEQGMRVHLMLENVGDNSHNVFAAKQADADSNHVDTPASAAINSSETIDPGASANLTFTIPDDAEGLYLWCDVQGHEAAGMWLEASVSAASNTTEESDETTGNETGTEDGADTQTEEEGSAIPAPGALALATAVAGAALVRRER